MILDIENRLIDLDKVNCIKFFIGYDQRVVFSNYCNEVVVVRPDEEKIKKIMDIISDDEFYKIILNSALNEFTDERCNVFIKKDSLLGIDRTKKGIRLRLQERKINLDCNELQREVIINKIYGNNVVHI